MRKWLWRVRFWLLQRFLNIEETFYINGADVLPPPLTAEEERVVFARMKEHDPAAREALITHNLRLVVYIARKFESSGVGLEDLISIGTIGLIYFITYLILRASTRLNRYMGETGNNVMMRLMGLILMVIAVECFVSGFKPIMIDILQHSNL